MNILLTQSTVDRTVDFVNFCWTIKLTCHVYFFTVLVATLINCCCQVLLYVSLRLYRRDECNGDSNDSVDLGSYI